MYNIPHREKFYQDEHYEFIVITTSIYNESTGEYDDVEITSEDMVEDSYECYESIMDQESLNFQNCLSSYVKFSIRNIEVKLYMSWLNVKKIILVDIENETFEEVPVGDFLVVSDNLSHDGIIQDIVAYDDMFSIINCPIEGSTEIYKELRSSDITVRDLRDNFLNEFAIDQDPEETLINDDIVLPAVQFEDGDLFSAEDIIKFLAELNAVFPHIGKDGLLHWIELDVGDPNIAGLYPGFYPSEHSYPGIGYHGNFYHIYKEQYVEGSVVWANYDTLKPDGVQIRNENNEIAYFANSENSKNPYTIINNFLCYGLSYGTYEQIAERILRKIKLINYVPFKMEKMGDPCLEVGDRVMIHVLDAVQERSTFLSYIFNKRTKGIICPFENIQTNGTYDLSQYDINTNKTAAKVKNLDNRVGNIEKSGSGPLQIVSVAALPDNPQLNVLYLIQGEVTVT